MRQDSSRSQGPRGNALAGRSASHLAALSFALLCLIGCSETSTPPPNRRPATTAVQPNPSPPTGPATAVAPAALATPVGREATVATPPMSSVPAMPPPQSAATTSVPSIHLSTGVALAQTGPEGTMMGFSVDYEFAQGQPDSEGYVWVIERAHGNAARQQVRLTAKGTLQAMIQKWRPEDGPFTAHIEDRKGNPLSELIEMQQSGL
jgi:hypothetical protein